MQPMRRLVDALAFSARALLLFVRVETGLRRLSLPVLTERLGLQMSDPRPTDGQVEVSSGLTSWDIARTLRRVGRVSRFWPFGDTCLRRSLVAGAMLRRAHPVLVIGVRKSDGQVLAHSWLRIDGLAYDPLSESYTTLLSPS